MKTVTKFSLLVFAPVLLAFLVPALFLLPAGGILALLAVFDPTLPLSDVAPYGLWIIGPVVLASGLFLTGTRLYSFYRIERSRRVAWIIIWAIFSVALFIAIWIGLSVVTSLGASDQPVQLFLKWTALTAAMLTLFAQVLVIPWLYVVSKWLLKTQTAGNRALQQE